MSAFDGDRLDVRDAKFVARVLPAARVLSNLYLRLRVEGRERLTAAPTLYVSNHNGGLAGPDIACTLTTLWDTLGPEHPVYALAHDFAMRQVPAFGAVLQRFGAIRASPANARRALASGAQVLVYPGGDLEAYRTTTRRDEIILGSRTGFVRVAREARAPIVPIVAYGAHRSALILTDGEAFAKRIGLKRWARLERFPVAFALPWIIVLAGAKDRLLGLEAQRALATAAHAELRVLDAGHDLTLEAPLVTADATLAFLERPRGAP